MTQTRAERQPVRHRVSLRILDHQVVGPDDELLGNVDDLELVITPDGWSITALLVGPAALGRRLPGKLGEWTVAIWRRLQTSPDPHPAWVPVAAVRDIGSAITVDPAAAGSLAAAFGLELWLREFVVSRIPGAKGGGDERAEGGSAAETGAWTSGPSPSRQPQPQPRPQPSSSPTTAPAPAWTSGPEPGSSGGGPRTGSVAQVLGARVFAHDGSELGVVHELVCAEPAPGRARDHLRVTHLQYGHHHAGSELGYDSDPRQGPLVVGAVVRWWQRGYRVAPIEDVVDLDLEARTVRVRSHARHAHPHTL